MAEKAKTKPESPDLTLPPEDDTASVKDKGKNKSKDKKKKKGGLPIVPILVLLVIIGAIVAVMVFNVLNIREQYIMPYLRKAPLIGSLMPTASPSPDASETGAYANMTQEQLITEITNRDYQIQKLQADAQTATDQQTQDAQTITNLQGMVSQMEQYRQIKAEFDTMIANGDPNAYAQFFSAISPENAAALYQEVVGETQYAADAKKLANDYSLMSPDAAAAALEQLLTTSSDLVVQVLSNMDSAHIADILNEMTAANVAVVTRLLAPTAVPVTVLPTAPPLPTPVPVITPAPADTAAIGTPTPVPVASATP